MKYKIRLKLSKLDCSWQLAAGAKLSLAINSKLNLKSILLYSVVSFSFPEIIQFSEAPKISTLYQLW